MTSSKTINCEAENANLFNCRQNLQMAADANASSLSLEDAVTEKYCAGSEEDAQALPAHKAIKESAVAFRPGIYTFQKLQCYVYVTIPVF